MTDDDAKQIAKAVSGPVKELLDKVITVLELHNARLEVLELERAFRRDESTTPAPDGEPQ